MKEVYLKIEGRVQGIGYRRWAVSKAKEVTEKVKICLMSPAASSYEYFKNFEEKGKMYKKYIKGD